MRFLPVAAALSLGISACSAPAAETAVDDLSSADRVGTDVQVLQIWTPGRVFPLPAAPWHGPTAADVSLDAREARTCPVVRATPDETYEHSEVDCTAAFQRLAPLEGTREIGPVITPLRFLLTKRVGDGQVYADPDFCNRFELRAVVRDSAFEQASFAGIGFATSRGDAFTPKSELQEVGRVRLADGASARVFRFSGISTCISSHDSTSGNTYKTFAFKPYAAFDANDVRYKVWENVPMNHAIGRSWPGAFPHVDSTGFDRQEQLLAR
jgi:hypothetical protein